MIIFEPACLHGSFTVHDVDFAQRRDHTMLVGVSDAQGMIKEDCLTCRQIS